MVHYSIMMKWIQELRALPVRYSCNYILLGGLGLAFEALVLAIRQGGLLVSRDLQLLAAAAMLVVIPQTAAEYFRPDGDAGFFLRFCASAAHLVLFCTLVLLQLNIDLPLLTAGGLLSGLYLVLSYCEVHYRGKGMVFLLPCLFFCIFLLLPAMDEYASGLISGNMLIFGNILLFLILYCTWGHDREKIQKTQHEEIQ